MGIQYGEQLGPWVDGTQDGGTALQWEPPTPVGSGVPVDKAVWNTVGKQVSHNTSLLCRHGLEANQTFPTRGGWRLMRQFLRASRFAKPVEQAAKKLLGGS